MTLTTEERTARATDLLQLLIRNQCVNDGTIETPVTNRNSGKMKS